MRITFIQKLIDFLRGKRKTLSTITRNNNIQISKKDTKFVEINIEGINNTVNKH